MAEVDSNSNNRPEKKAREFNPSSSTLAYQFLENILLNRDVKLSDFEQETFLQSLDQEIINRFSLKPDVARRLLRQVKKDILHRKEKKQGYIPKPLDEIFSDIDFTQHQDAIKSHNETSPLLASRAYFELNTRDKIVVRTIFENRKRDIAFKKSNLPKATFYKRVKKLLQTGFLLAISENGKVVHFSEVKKYQNIIVNPLFFSSSNLDDSKSHFSGGVSTESSQVSLSQNDQITQPIPNQSNNQPDSPETKSETLSDFPPITEHHPEKLETSSPTPSKNPHNGDSFHDKIIRSHNYSFKLPILHKSADFDYLLSKSNLFGARHLNNWTQYQLKGSIGLTHLEATIQINRHVVAIWLNNIFGEDPFENDSEANYRMLRIKAYLEDEFPGLELQPTAYSRRVESRGVEHAWVHHTLALKAKQQNVTLRGRHWEVDHSKATPELESIHPLDSNYHLSQELEDFDYRAENGKYFRDLVTDITKINIDLKNQDEEYQHNFELVQQNFTDVSQTLAQIETIASYNADQFDTVRDFANQVVQSVSSTNNILKSTAININQQKNSLKSIANSLVYLTTILLNPKPSFFAKIKKKLIF